MVNKGIAREKYNVDIVPAQGFYLLFGGGKHIVVVFHIWRKNTIFAQIRKN